MRTVIELSIPCTLFDAAEKDPGTNVPVLSLVRAHTPTPAYGHRTLTTSWQANLRQSSLPSATLFPHVGDGGSAPTSEQLRPNPSGVPRTQRLVTPGLR